MFGDNSKKLFPFISDRAIAEKILELVPSIHLPVYERITPPLTDFPLTMMLPMPDSEPRLPARVTAFTSAPWGRVGLFLVVFDNPEYTPWWGMWRLRQPSTKTGTRFPFFRLGDYDDAQLLTWLVFKPFIEAQGMVIDDLDLPDTDQYLGPWHKVRSILRFKEEPEWFQKVLNGEGKG